MVKKSEMQLPKVGRTWTGANRKIIIVNGEKINLRKLQHIGNSLFLIMPKIWVDFSCKPDTNGDYWVQISYDVNKDFGRITITGYKEKGNGIDKIR